MDDAAVLIADLPADRAEDAVALWEASGLTRPWNDPRADLALATTTPTSTVLAATDGGGRLLGTAMVGFDGHRGWLYYLAVAADVRRQGLGRRLVRASEVWLAERGAPKAQLMVRSSGGGSGGEDAVAFYAALGYQRSDVVVLGRSLDPPADAPTG